MRPPRLILLLFCFISLPIFLTLLSLLSAHPRHAASTESGNPSRTSRFNALFSFNTPTSLFSPSAVISLTDDNSTFFLARPAAFGPLLPSNGLSGQLWVGSGFGDDGLRKGGAAFGVEGELGCSDVPGWGEGDQKHDDEQEIRKKTQRKTLAHVNEGSANAKTEDRNRRRSGLNPSPPVSDTGAAADSIPTEGDGTDDHLHHPLPESEFSKPTKPGQPAEHEPIGDGSKPPTHADIQSLQESAEIAGKVVLLSRGGCGFLEKVKWAQRRGGIALIVGDDVRGGPIVTMYAHGDTSNITIPALFTSHTTAHLLSSLIPPDTFVDDSAEAGKPSSGDDKNQVKAGSRKKGGRKGKALFDGPTFTPTNVAAQPTSTPRPSIVPARIKGRVSAGSDASLDRKRSRSWLHSLFSALGLGSDIGSSWHMPEDSRRPPSSGHLDWILLEDWFDEDSKTGKKKSSSSKDNAQDEKNEAKSSKPKTSSSQQSSGDDFVIGVQDWRDPDLVSPAKHKGPSKSGKSTVKPGSKPQPSDQPKSGDGQPSKPTFSSDTLKGGSITPGSGEYDSPSGNRDSKTDSNDPEKMNDPPSESKSNDAHQQDDWWFSHLRWTENEGAEQVDSSKAGQSSQGSKSPGSSTPKSEMQQGGGDEDEEEHEGLWVTLSPTSMSSSPFFDTLLVLVVSPLITLTVVYALLLLRSRIRRRRWRAPKSVVDRLPVRTYHTMSCSSTASSSQVTSPDTSSPTSPLLRASPRSVATRSRPRSQTTSGVIIPPSSSVEESAIGPAASLQEKPVSRSPTWRRRYTGRQVECVVCLEEYVDGQSRVMSLPCGHEFHVECM